MSSFANASAPVSVATAAAGSSRSAAGRPGTLALTRLTARLTRARLASREGETLLYLASILAYTVATCAALTVAGGTWMFYSRGEHPERVTAWQAAAQSSGYGFDRVAQQYLIMSLLACAMLVPAMVGLASNAAVLGARSRERRLAVLRLLGLSGADVTRMSLLDALVQSAAGAVIGTVVYLITLPAWGSLTVMGTRITPGEMILPLGYLAVVLVGVILIGQLSAWRGLRQVRISPLGVSRRANGPRAGVWRVIVFLGTMFAAPHVIGSLPSQYRAFVVYAMIMAVIFVFDLAGSWFTQLLSRGLARLRGPVMRWTARRIQAAPTATWHRVSAMGLLAFIGGFISSFMSLMPQGSDTGTATETGSAEAFVYSIMWDCEKGAIITLAFGFVLTATSILISQASGTIERAEQSRSLRRMGAPAGYGLRVMWMETYTPLLLAVLGGAGLGTLMASLLTGMSPVSGISPLMLGIIIVGLVLTGLALRACHPLYYRLLGETERHND
ncbi:FtsX-like permease family protein [Actinomyces viscosus]|uniref:FtsX-like permease family n=1 Tax=Actinomyces viscosus TaxID=1656 RepID=A0A448PIX9_ACTVI|nr:FtsX-like permease family protein [Actinomyces viscosus]TFH53934.1 FtsX-like permease family protein [Actinomyces viscosus]VEI14921.1 FtsX-like permease family [Actinomyces viscosus]